MTASKLAYSRQEAAEQIGMSVDTIAAAIRTGKLRAKRVGNRIRITDAELRKWFSELDDA